MVKQEFGRIRKTLAILLVALFVISVTSAAVSARVDRNNLGLKNVTKTTIAGNNTTVGKTIIAGKNTAVGKTTIVGKNTTVGKTTIAGKNATVTKIIANKTV
jgi:UDP-3-O-[3-hydroxymyristoyl] glucosamine N-acyltransferase